MRKAIKYLFASVAMFATACILLNSCNTEDETVTVYAYAADGQISAVDDMSASMAIPYFNTEIEKVLDGVNYSPTEKDNEVIAACNALYETLKQEHPAWGGEVRIIKYISTSGTDPEIDKGTTLKTYTF